MYTIFNYCFSSKLNVNFLRGDSIGLILLIFELVLINFSTDYSLVFLVDSVFLLSIA
jgi:hypothetical protein